MLDCLCSTQSFLCCWISSYKYFIRKYCGTWIIVNDTDLESLHIFPLKMEAIQSSRMLVPSTKQRCWIKINRKKWRRIREVSDRRKNTIVIYKSLSFIVTLSTVTCAKILHLPRHPKTAIKEPHHRTSERLFWFLLIVRPTQLGTTMWTETMRNLEIGSVSSPLCVWKLERVCSQTQLCQLRYFNDYTRQLRVSAPTGHLQVVLKRT